MDIKEEWKYILNIPLLNGYECSNFGNIRNLSKNYFTNGSITQKGYVKLYVRKKGDKVYCFPIHQLVLLCFIGPCPYDHCPDHKDTIRHNNRLDNLQYISNIENRKQGGRKFKGKMREDGFGDKISEALSGEGHPLSRLKNEDIFKIRSLSDNGMLHKEIAILFKMSRSQISRISRRTAWDHI